MITYSDSQFTYDLGNYYVIIPYNPRWKLDDFIHKFNAKKVKDGFSYNSGKNDEWIDSSEIKKLIKENLKLDI